jgi:hypothetical protein
MAEELPKHENLSVENMLKLLEKMSAEQRVSMEKSITILAEKITHPDPSPKQRENALRTIADRNKQAAENEAAKAYKRKHCTSPADPSRPHRRTGQQWQNWNNTSVIAWMYTYMTEKTPTGSREVGPVAFGVCQWCNTEFKPGDPDYMDALGYGGGLEMGTHSMNVHTGLWING